MAYYLIGPSATNPQTLYPKHYTLKKGRTPKRTARQKNETIKLLLLYTDLFRGFYWYLIDLYFFLRNKDVPRKANIAMTCVNPAYDPGEMKSLSETHLEFIGQALNSYVPE